MTQIKIREEKTARFEIVEHRPPHTSIISAPQTPPKKRTSLEAQRPSFIQINADLMLFVLLSSRSLDQQPDWSRAGISLGLVAFVIVCYIPLWILTLMKNMRYDDFSAHRVL